jgi:presenilin-like A22 family membrane protease
MKHTYKVTLILVAIFFLSQIIGLAVINKNINVQKIFNKETGQIETEINYASTPYLETVQVENESLSYIPIFVAIIVGTIIGLLIAKYRKIGIWRAWFLLAVIITLYKAFSSFIPALIAFVVAVFLAMWKIYRPNIYVHNFTELFIYAGIATIFVPILNVISAVVLLILIAIYDAFAVWQSKHMITLAKFQAQSVFAGLSIAYNTKTDKIVSSKNMKKIEQMQMVEIPKPPKYHAKREEIKTAILGGGDIAFPMLFSGAVMKGILMTNPPSLSLLKTLPIPILATIALAILFYKAEKDKFYPAMPFIGAGCFIGYGVMFLLGFL